MIPRKPIWFLVGLALTVSGVAPSSSAAPAMRAAIKIGGAISFDGHLSANPQARCWTSVFEVPGTGLGYALGSVGYVTVGARAVAGPFWVVLAGCGQESSSGGSGTIWNLLAESPCAIVCVNLVSLVCEPPPGPSCGTYQRSGKTLTADISNVFATTILPGNKRVGPYDHVKFSARTIVRRETRFGTTDQITATLTH